MRGVDIDPAHGGPDVILDLCQEVFGVKLLEVNETIEDRFKAGGKAFQGGGAVAVKALDRGVKLLVHLRLSSSSRPYLLSYISIKR